jgi:hypothetical protein
MIYSKPALNIVAHVSRLKAKGLTVADEPAVFADLSIANRKVVAKSFNLPEKIL